MAIDFLIFGLILVSFIINLLALGAFWITPGLRTTANRFTINLLIVNIIGCFILAPTLILSNSGYFVTNSSKPVVSDEIASAINSKQNDNRIEFYSKPGNHQMIIRHNGQLVEQEGIILKKNVSTDQRDLTETRTIETIYKCNTTFCKELTINESSDTIVITEIEGENHIEDILKSSQLDEDNYEPVLNSRFWSIDFAAALSALAILLVVGDTWCAITDPLRYNLRISGVKSWVFIALTWAIAIFFSALSAFRNLNFESNPTLSKQRRFTDSYADEFYVFSSSKNIFGLIFACLYFIIIILLPFGFVCGMYWRIFSEARENGLRMRQNGSSPLLQSALNLTHQQPNAAIQCSNNLLVHRNSVSSSSSCGGGGGGLLMQIDQRKGSPTCHRRDSAAKILLPTISDDAASDSSTDHIPDQDSKPVPIDRNTNILLTLQAASGEIKRNYSARQLPLLGTSSQDLCESNHLRGIRQVHSSPNLQKYTQVHQNLIADLNCSPQLLGHHMVQHTQLQHFNSHLSNHHHHHHRHSHIQVPSIQASPKALSYMSSLRHRLSNASSLFKYREESRAARISILVVIMFLVSYLPFGFMVLLQSCMATANFQESTQLAIFMILLGNLSSPIIFAYRNKRVRRGIKRLFGFDKRSHGRYLQRQSSSSCRGSKNSITIKRNSSKVSTYSSKSCKYLTPQNSLLANSGPGRSMDQTIKFDYTPPIFRPNSSCSTIVNFNPDRPTIGISELVVEPIEKMTDRNIIQNGATTAANDDITQSIDQFQRNIINMDTIPPPVCSSSSSGSGGGNNKFKTRQNLFKRFFKSSKNLSCTATKFCMEGDATNEPTEV